MRGIKTCDLKSVIFLIRLKLKKIFKAVVITGSGKKAFCAGQDLNELKNFNESKN